MSPLSSFFRCVWAMYWVSPWNPQIETKSPKFKLKFPNPSRRSPSQRSHACSSRVAKTYLKLDNYMETHFKKKKKSFKRGTQYLLVWKQKYCAGYSKNKGQKPIFPLDMWPNLRYDPLIIDFLLHELDIKIQNKIFWISSYKKTSI